MRRSGGGTAGSCGPARICITSFAVCSFILVCFNGIASEMKLNKVASYTSGWLVSSSSQSLPSVDTSQKLDSSSGAQFSPDSSTQTVSAASSSDIGSVPPVQAFAQVPTQAPAQVPDQVPAQSPAQAPAQTLSQATVEAPAGSPLVEELPPGNLAAQGAGDAFSLVAGGSGGCSGGVFPVLDEAICKDAATKLGKKFIGAFEAHSEPSGCLHRVSDDDVLFNSLQTANEADPNRKLICSGLAATSTQPAAPARAPSPPAPPSPSVPEPPLLPEAPPEASGKYSLAPKRGGCVEGTFQILDLKRCQKAAKALGKKFVGMLASLGDPFGCLHRTGDRDLFFNRFRTEQVKDDRQLVCSTEPGPKVVQRKPISPQEAAQLKIYCFAWTARTPREDAIMAYARKLFAECDGYAFFTDRDAAGEDEEDLIRVDVPATKQKRNEQGWLLLKNMVGLIPSWSYLLSNNIIDGYDWIVNAELDHFMVAPLLRKTIADYMNIVIQGALPGQDPWSDAILQVYGNAFLFNAKLAKNMRTEWASVGKIIPDGQGMGCPVITGKRAHNEGHCEQDMVYENLRDHMKSHVLIVGANGCGNVATSDSLVGFPLACWQDFPFGDTDEGRMKAIREIALLWTSPDSSAASKHCQSRDKEVQKKCESLFRAKNVPILHNIKTPAVHALARELLLPLADPK
eukprot:TRINITY_DN60664_c0_g1_i1.p1 TRINITY_DN60664_c0_g1~~TRINITY_DN60664_c0_g1_i1.p1  ORF type:complete len:683 (-),score=145.94 TRINITY_DN60664_c0_g1_i1:27-2075(-)